MAEPEAERGLPLRAPAEATSLLDYLMRERARAVGFLEACDVAIAAFSKAAHVPVPDVIRAHSYERPVGAGVKAVMGPAREMPALDRARVDQILALLKTGPKSTKEVVVAIGVDRLVTKQVLRRMAARGEIVPVGEGNGRKWELPGSS